MKCVLLFVKHLYKSLYISLCLFYTRNVAYQVAYMFPEHLTADNQLLPNILSLSKGKKYFYVFSK